MTCEFKNCGKKSNFSWNGQYLCYFHYLFARAKSDLIKYNRRLKNGKRN